MMTPNVVQIFLCYVKWLLNELKKYLFLLLLKKKQIFRYNFILHFLHTHLQILYLFKLQGNQNMQIERLFSLYFLYI